MLRPWELKIEINYDCERPVYRQIADAIIMAVENGKLKPGDPLPGSRLLAGRLKVSRNTVVQALDLLSAEEWVSALPRKGIFIAEMLPFSETDRRPVPAVQGNGTSAKPALITFDDGAPDSQLAPMRELSRAYRQLFNRKSRWQMMGYVQELGDPDFRAAVMQMLNYRRGLNVGLEQICTTRGSQMAMYLIAHCLIRPGEYVLVESPGYRPAWQAFEQAGARLLPVSVDKDGIITSEITAYLKRFGQVKALYTTPHHQFPTTVTMSERRRQELVTLSLEHGFTIIEDDYDHEFHFGNDPVMPLSSRSGLENFAYIGTFSKILAPAIRIGYVAAGKALISKLGALRKIIDVQGDTIMEQAVLQLIQDGDVKKHLQKSTNEYRAKRDHVEGLLQKHLSAYFNYDKPHGGLAFWLSPATAADPTLLTAMLADRGLRILRPGSFYYSGDGWGIRLGYGSPSLDQLGQGIRIIGECMAILNT